MGDNITPPQQAFNWVADVYGSTDEIKARGQVIVGLLHQDIGHLGIFVSGKVAKKEHAQIVSVLKSIEALPPGLYGMQIHEVKGRDGKVEYEVDFHERRLEDIAEQLNRLERADEKPFEAVAAMSEFNQRAYELFAQPFVQALGNEVTAKVSRQFHPLRVQRWAILRPESVARVARARRRRRSRRSASRPPPTTPPRKVQKMVSDARQRVARLLPRGPRRDQRGRVLPDLRQRVLALPRRQARGADERAAESAAEPRELPFVKEALASIDEGGFPEALARVGALLARRGAPLPLARLALKQRAHRRVSRPAAGLHARRVAAHPRRAGHHRPLRAREGDRDAAQACSRSPSSSRWATRSPQSCPEQFHSLRFQRWAFSDLNPWLASAGPAAQAVEGPAPSRPPPTTPAARSRN